MNRLRLLKRDSGRMHEPELCSLFLVSLPRSLSSLLYAAAAHALGLAEPNWTSDGEILNRDRVPRRLQSLAPADERFALLGSAPEVFGDMTGHLDSTALRRGFAYKDVVQPFVVGGWDGLGDFKVSLQRRTSTAASSGRGGDSRRSGATRSCSAGSNRSLRRCGSGCAPTSQARRLRRRFPSSCAPPAVGGTRAARSLRRRASAR